MREYKSVAPASWNRGGPCAHSGRASDDQGAEIIEK